MDEMNFRTLFNRLSIFKRTLTLTLLMAVAGACGTPPGALGPNALKAARENLPFTNPQTDQVEISTNGAHFVAALHDEDKGDSVLLYSEDGKAWRTVSSAHEGGRFLTPALAPNSRRIAFIRPEAPDEVRVQDQVTIQYRGTLELSSVEGLTTTFEQVKNAARVLGWMDDNKLVITTYTAGYMPQERPVVVEIAEARFSPLLKRDEGKIYNLTLKGDKVIFARAATSVITAPLESDILEVMMLDTVTGGLTTVTTEQGVMPVDFELDQQHQLLSYRIEGTGESRQVDLVTGEKQTLFRPFDQDREVESGAEDHGTPSPFGAIAVPYMHQKYDTPDSFDGSWACGPTSIMMIVAAHQKLAPWPIKVSVPYEHESRYGRYISDIYTAYGTTFNRSFNDPKGRKAYGAYGWMVRDGGTYYNELIDFTKKHDLAVEARYSSFSLAALKEMLDKKALVIAGTKLTSAGHVITITGYDGDKLIANDPWGNANEADYGKKMNGEKVRYSWNQLKVDKILVAVYNRSTKPPQQPSGKTVTFYANWPGTDGAGIVKLYNTPLATADNIKGRLRPDKYGPLTYDILEVAHNESGWFFKIKTEAFDVGYTYMGTSDPRNSCDSKEGFCVK
jgi:hypothetical protein